MREPYKLLDLFSGIGGFSLGLERTGGFKTVAFCEIEPFPRKVLAKHWPEVPIYDDVRTLTAKRLAADGITVDAICGGFPCQDISTAGKGAGLAGERSGLWSEYARIVGELRPRYVIVENVAALLGRGMGRVLGDLAALGYDAEWHCIPASAVGAPHRRDRLWIVANARSGRCGTAGEWQVELAGRAETVGTSETLAYANSLRKLQPEGREQKQRRRSGDSGTHVADPVRHNVEGLQPGGFDAKIGRGSIQRQARPCGDGIGWWATEPALGRVAHGVPDRAHRLKALGNAVVPQIPELIGRAILAADSA
jgi:DNA (cytosine-5)-methyltransferase 1